MRLYGQNMRRSSKVGPRLSRYCGAVSASALFARALPIPFRSWREIRHRDQAARSSRAADLDSQAAPMVERGQRLVESVRDAMRHAMGNAPPPEVILRVGKRFADAFKFKAMNLTAGRCQNEIGPARLDAHALQFCGSSYVTGLAMSDVGPQPIWASMFTCLAPKKPAQNVRYCRASPGCRRAAHRLQRLPPHRRKD
jgi:hypothetical protein